MKKGKEYESLVYKIFSEYFQGFTLKQNDQIRGKQSGLSREIDVSIRGKFQGNELLFAVQAKDYKNHKSDINVLGVFSAVLKDIGAAKGFLVCASGFAKTNSQYARTLGIELLSVEDIESKKWKANIEIPVIYVLYDLKYGINISIPAYKINELIKLYGTVTISEEDRFNFSLEGENFYHASQHLQNFYKDGLINFTEKKELTFENKMRILKFPLFTFPLASITTEPLKRFYLKYLTPEEFRGIKDHLNKTFIPTTFKVNEISLKIDDSFIPIDEANIPVNPYGFSITIGITPFTIKK